MSLGVSSYANQPAIAGSGPREEPDPRESILGLRVLEAGARTKQCLRTAHAYGPLVYSPTPLRV